MNYWNSNEKVNKKVLSMDNEIEGKILEVGSGKGELSLELKEKGDLTLLDKENNLFYKEKIVLADLNKSLPFKDKTFDNIFCIEVLEHLENPRHVFREFKRLLKKDGIITISTPNILNWKGRISLLLKGNLWGFREEDYKISGHITPVILYDFKRICEELNLEIIEVYGNLLFEKSIILKIQK